MNHNWASLPTATPAGEFLKEIRAGLCVRTIMTSREDLETLTENCSPDCMNDPQLAEFDFVPATDAAGEEIVGVFRKGSSTRNFEKLRESYLLEADSSLLDFIEAAESRPFAFLIDKRRIVGMVTHADLQRLPVYTLLFSLISAVEMQLIAWIRLARKDQEDQWVEVLDEDDRRGVNSRLKSSIASNVALDALSAMTIEQERIVARRLGLIVAGHQIDNLLGIVVKYRNSICHCKEIALTEERISDIKEFIDAAFELSEFLAKRLKEVK